MKFTVTFEGVSISGVEGKIFSSEYVLSVRRKEVGLNLLNEFNLTATEIERDYADGEVDYNYTACVANDIAVESNLFLEKNNINIKAPKNYLNDYAIIEFNQEKKIFEYKVDENKLIADWKNAGFPTCLLNQSEIELRKIEIEKQAERENIQRKEREEAKEKQYKYEEERMQREKETREKYKEEKENWIKEYGSDYLKDCLELDVSANKNYIIERAGKEFPDYAVDADNLAEWEDRFSPSEEALQELKRLRIESPELNSDIVWLTHPCYEVDYDDREQFPREAVVIRKYLGKYNLIREF